MFLQAFSFLWKLRVQAFFTVNFYQFIYPRRRILLSLVLLVLITLLTACAWKLLPPAFFVRGDGVSSYFIGLGAAVFGLLAIGFSLQSLVIQNTAENRSAGLYEIEGKDWVPTAIFIFLSLLSLGFFFLSAWANGVDAANRKICIVASMPAIAFVLWSLYILYRHTFHRMSPTKVIERVEIGIRKDLKWMAKIAGQNAIVIEWKAKDPSVNQHVAAGAMFSRMKPRLEHASQRIEFLFDYHDKLVAAQEHYAAREVLDAVRRIILEYLAARSTSSLRHPLGFFGASTSDSQDFLINTLEDLVTRGKGYIHESNDRGITYVIGVFQDIIVASAGMKFYPERQDDNPVFTQCRAYFDQIADAAMTESAIEALYQSVKAYAQMGQTALQFNLSIEFHTIVRKLQAIGDFAGRRKQMEPIWSACIHTVSKWIGTILSKIYVDELQFSLALEAWIGIAVAGLQNGMRDPAITGSPLVMPLLSLQLYVDQVFAKWKSEQGKEKKRLESMLLRIIEQYKDKLYTLAQSIKTTKGQLVEETSRLITNLCKILFEFMASAPTEYDKRKPKELIYRLLNIPANFIYHAGKSEVHGGFESLVDTIVRIGIMAYKQGDEDTAKKSVELVTRIAASAAEEKVCSYGSIHAPRIMVKACYFGILALKDGKAELLQYTKQQIKTFESALALHQEEMLNALSYDHALKRAEQVMGDHVRAIRDEKQKVHDHWELIVPGNDAERAFLPMVEVIDIDKFTLEQWGFVDGSSEIGRENPPASPDESK